MKRWGPTVVVLAASVLLFLAIDRVVERKRVIDEITHLRTELFAARSAAVRCRESLTNSEARLREFDDVIGDMRARVDSFESLDPRGVPQERYEEYMESFDSYNDSVAAWEDRAGRLRASEAACRTTIEDHNRLSDSLRAVLDAAGILPTNGAP